MLTRLFPSSANPVLGTFCLERAKALAEHADVRVMVPTPWFPDLPYMPKTWQNWSRVERKAEVCDNIKVTYPRYVSIPKIATFSQGYAIAYSAYQDFKENYADWQPDIIDGHFAFPDGYAAVQLGKRLGCPAIVTCHGADLRLYPEIMIVKTMIENTMKSAAKVIAVSTFLKKRSLELGCPEQNSVFLSNGVDPNKFALQNQYDCRLKLGLPRDRKIGVSVGYLIPRKNQTVLIQAVQRIREQGQTPPLIILVGDGPDRQQLQKLTEQLNLGEHILFAGQKSHDEIGLWMGAADWLLLSSTYEGWATVYFEAMSCGRPVLTSDVSSAKDAVCEPEYGCVVENNTPEGFAQAIIDASAREFDASKIRAYAEQHSWAQWAVDALLLFKKAIAGHAN